jgi:transcriptional regulator with XRE-family HTH domain
MAKFPNPDAIRKARKSSRLKWTQKDLSESFEVKLDVISRLESGDRRAVGLWLVEEMAKKFEVEYDSLVMDVPDDELNNPQASTPEEQELLRMFRLASNREQLIILACSFCTVRGVSSETGFNNRMAVEFSEADKYPPNDPLSVIRDAANCNAFDFVKPCRNRAKVPRLSRKNPG